MASARHLDSLQGNLHALEVYWVRGIGVCADVPSATYTASERLAAAEKELLEMVDAVNKNVNPPAYGPCCCRLLFSVWGLKGDAGMHEPPRGFSRFPCAPMECSARIS